MIRNYLDASGLNWDLYIPILTAAYRGTVHPATGYTPNFLMLGRVTTMPVDMEFLRLRHESSDLDTYVLDLQANLAKCYHVARENLKRAAERQQKVHNTRIAQHVYHPGQAVMKRTHKSSKFDIPWVGPYLVTKTLSDCLYIIADKRKTYAIHHDSLKPVSDAVCPAWAKKLQLSIRSKF